MCVCLCVHVRGATEGTEETETLVFERRERKLEHEQKPEDREPKNRGEARHNEETKRETVEERRRQISPAVCS